jgi:pimeloyl-ACP methyl ester carboxylesterase
MTQFILVPGGNHGGWWYEPLVAALRNAGHAAEALTLAGLSPDGPLAPTTNLDTHVAEVADRLQAFGEQVVLVGHSYAGSVITGVADQSPERVAALMYLDAFVPESGDSCWSMTNTWERKWIIDGSGETGLAVEPLSFFDPRARPHPIGTYLQTSKLCGAFRTVKRKHYVAAVGAEWLKLSPFVELTQRLRQDPDWVVTELDSGHNLLAQGPDLLLPLLLEEARLAASGAAAGN